MGRLMVLALRYLCAVLIGMSLFSDTSHAQSVVIDSPSDKALFQQVGNRADIPVCVTATDVPSGGGVEFVLDEGIPAESSAKHYSSPYQYTFSSVPTAEHTVDVYVIDSDGNRLSAHDQHTQVGVGEIIVAMGDSITAGEDDDITSDNWSADGRVGPYTNPVNYKQYGGFEPILNDTLTAIRGYPHWIINAGKGGEKISGAQSRIGGLVSTYPTAGKWLIAYGTNDANSGTSTSSFKSGLQSVVNTVRNAIPDAKIYMPKIFYGGSSLDAKELSYDNAIGDIIRATPNCYWGADLDTLFRANHSLYDHLTAQSGAWFSTNSMHHPNGVGIQQMAMLWKLALVDRAILVTDGVLSSMGSTYTDKIHLEGTNTLGLNSDKLLLVIDCPTQTPPPPGTCYIGDWWCDLALTGASDFDEGSLSVTMRLEDSSLSSVGASQWEQIWLARDDIMLPTTRQVDPKSSSSHDLTATVSQPGQIAAVADVEPPVTSCSTTPEGPDGDNGWYITIPLVALGASDGTGGLVTTYYMWNSEHDVQYTESFPARIGSNDLWYYSVDQSGNWESGKGGPLEVDTTVPSKPSVSVGRYADPAEPLTITWMSQDEESGISGCKYAVGSSPGAVDIQDWTDADSSGTISWTPESSAGTKCYFSVKAKNLAGLSSEAGVSDGDIIAQEFGSLGLVKKLSGMSSSPVLVRHVLVTADMGGMIYVQEADRSAGMPVYCQSVSPGHEVTVVGWARDYNGERVLVDAECEDIVEDAVPRPLGVRNSVLKPDASAAKGAPGLSMNGLFVKTWGKVQSVSSNRILISDGSMGTAGVYVDTTRLSSALPIGSYISVKGISSVTNTGRIWKPMVKPRSASDVALISPSSQ